VVAELTFEESSEPALQALRRAAGVNFAMVPEAVQAQVLAQLSENAGTVSVLQCTVLYYNVLYYICCSVSSAQFCVDLYCAVL